MRRIAIVSLLFALSVHLLDAQSITLERVAAKRWRATYALPQPAKSLRFERPAAFFRERAWTIATPGYHLARSGDWQVLTLDSNAVARKEIVVEFDEFTEPLPKEYEFFQPFTDGSVAIYSGHFNAIPVGEKDSPSIRRLRIIPPAGTHVIVRGRLEKGGTTFEDAIGDGTYIYIGTGRPIATPDVIAIIDPGMPEWLTTVFNERLPQLFHAYAERFGSPLPWKPVVLFGFDDNGSSGLSSGGGTLTGLINMTLSGAEWRTRSPRAFEQAVYLIAHESAHLWNGKLVANRANGSGAWMHEGSADAIATEMLLALGVVDSARYLARREEALNRCAAAVAQGPVETAIARGAIKAAYDCGFVMAMWTTGLVTSSRRTGDLFTFWQELIRQSKGNGNAYDESNYYRALTALGASDQVVERMRAFLQSRDSFDIALAGLNTSGIGVHDGQGAPPPAYQQEAARGAMIHIMQQACGRVSLTWASPVRTGAVATCEPFAKELQVFRVQNLRLRDQGAALYDAVGAVCSAGGTLELQNDDGVSIATVRCTRPLVARPRWFELGRSREP